MKSCRQRIFFQSANVTTFEKYDKEMREVGKNWTPIGWTKNEKIIQLVYDTTTGSCYNNF